MTTQTAQEQADSLAKSLELLEGIGFGENAEYADPYEYLEGQILDINYTLNAKKELISAQLLVGFGGPNIWETYRVDGSEIEIKCTWYSEPAYAYAKAPELAAEIWQVLEDMYLS